MSSIEVGTVNNIPSPREYLSTENQIDAENWFNYCNENPASTLSLLDDANGMASTLGNSLVLLKKV